MKRKTPSLVSLSPSLSIYICIYIYIYIYEYVNLSSLPCIVSMWIVGVEYWKLLEMEKKPGSFYIDSHSLMLHNSHFYWISLHNALKNIHVIPVWGEQYKYEKLWDVQNGSHSRVKLINIFNSTSNQVSCKWSISLYSKYYIQRMGDLIVL